MKNYGINKKLRKEKILYNLVKFQYLLLQYFSKNENMRDYYNQSIQKHFHGDFNKPLLEETETFAIPSGKYCNPVCLITSDLILRENISKLKKGLVMLLKNNYSHKFLGGFKAIDEVLKSVENMDDTLTWSYSSLNVGRFDFETSKTLSKYISYFDLYIRKVNSSYLAVEAHIYFDKSYLNNLQQLVDSDIDVVNSYIMSAFRRNKKLSGGKRTFAVGEYNKSSQKSDAIYESITSFKWMFYNELQRFFPTILHNLNSSPPSILFYQTNIDYREKGTEAFWSSLGVCTWNGQFINDSKKIFFQTELSMRYERNWGNDMIYIYHDKKVESSSRSEIALHQVLFEFSYEYSRNIFRFSHLEALNNIFSRKLVDYKLELNRIKLKKRQLYNVLKLRYKFECDMDIYERYVGDDIWENTEEKISELFGGKELKRSLDFRCLTRPTLFTMQKVKEQMEVLGKEFDSKSSIIQHLSEFKNEFQNRKMNFWMLIFALATLILVIFPDWALSIASFLENLFNEIVELFQGWYFNLLNKV